MGVFVICVRVFTVSYCLYCFFGIVSFIYIYIYIFILVLSVLVLGLLPPSDNSNVAAAAVVVVVIMNQCLSGEEQVQRFCKHRNETLGSIKCGDFLH